MKPFLLTSTCLAGLLFATSAQAQDTLAASAAASQPEPESTAEEQGAPDQAEEAVQPTQGVQDIVVTANRRSENLQRAPIAVSAVTGDTLESAGITRATELTTLIPALQVAPAAGPYNLFYLRGVGNFNGNALSDSAVAFNFANVFLSRPSSVTGFFYDLERVEVLKGPQGTLYGRNATGGAINVLPSRPELGVFGGDASFEYGNYEQIRVDGALNIPLGERAALRIAGIHVSHDGYLSDGTDDQEDTGARVSLRVEPSNKLSITVVGDYFSQGGIGPGIVPRRGTAAGVETATTLSPDTRFGFLSPQGQAVYTTTRAGPLGRNFNPIPADQVPYQDNEYWGISSTIELETDIGELVVIPGYREASLDYVNFVPGFRVRQVEESDQSSVEARFSTPTDIPVQGIFGAFYFNENITDPVVNYLHQVNGSYQNLDLTTESVAVFGRLIWEVTPSFRVNVGARQTWEDKTFQGNLLSVTRICTIGNCPGAPGLPYADAPPAATVPVPTLGPAPFGGLIIPGQLIQSATPITENEQASFDRFTWRVGADWDVGEQNLLYASYETGFKAGGFYFGVDNPATPGTVEGVYRPEEIEAFTLGSKNRFFDNRLQLNLELFYWRYSDQQISHLTIDAVLNAPVFGTENVGRATFKGFELDAQYVPSERTRLGFNVQYLDANYDEFIYTSPNQNGGVANGTACPNVGTPGAVYTIDCSGRRPPNAPEWTVNLSGQQRFAAPWGGDIVVDARAHWQSETLVGLEFVPLEFQDDYWLVDAAVTWYAEERKFFIGAYINNAFDETVAAAAFPTSFSSPPIYATSLRPPQTYGIRAGVRF